MIAACVAVLALGCATQADRHGDPLPAGAVRRIGTVRFRDGFGFYGDPVFSPDGKKIFTRSGAEGIRVWEADTGRPLRKIVPGLGAVWCVAVSPDGARLAVAGKDTVAVLDLRTGGKVASLECTDPWRSNLAFSPDGSRLALGTDEFVTVWETRSWKRVRRWKDIGGGVLEVSFAPDGRLRAGRAHGWELRLFDVEKGRALFPPPVHGSVLADLAFSADGKRVASIEREGRAHVWSLPGGRKERTLEAPRDSFARVALTHDGSRLAVASRRSVWIYDIERGKRLRKFILPGPFLRALLFSPDGRVVCAVKEHALHLWRLDDGSAIGPEGEETTGLAEMDLSADDRTLAARGDGVSLWNLESGDRVRTIARGEKVVAAALHPSADRLYAAVEKRGPEAWDVATGRKVETPLSRDPVTRIRVSPDGATLACVGYYEIRLVRAATGKGVALLKGRSRTVQALSFSADGRHLAEASVESFRDTPYSYLRLYAVPTGALEAEVTGPWPSLGAVAASPDGRLVAFGHFDGAVLLWRPESKEPPRELGRHKGEVLSAAFSADGLLLASGGRDGKVRLWEVPSFRPLAALEGHEGAVTGVRFLSDGARMVSVATDTTALLWDLVAALGASAPIDWDALGRPEGDRLVWQWLRKKDRAVEALRRRLVPAGPADVGPLVRRLDSDDPAEREAAMRDLVRLGPRAEAVLARERDAAKSAELKARLSALLEELRAPLASTPEHLRWIRAVAILERAGTPEARELLRVLGARAALGRLKRRVEKSER